MIRLPTRFSGILFFSILQFFEKIFLLVCSDLRVSDTVFFTFTHLLTLYRVLPNRKGKHKRFTVGSVVTLGPRVYSRLGHGLSHWRQCLYD